MEQAHLAFWVVGGVELLRQVVQRAHVKYPEVAVAVTIAGDSGLEAAEVLRLEFFLLGREVERQTSALSPPRHPQGS